MVFRKNKHNENIKRGAIKNKERYFTSLKTQLLNMKKMH